ncbi:ABC transporter ATP-binding protein [Thermosipho atlanticus]|uniref:ABC-2 type transport system ATP-binding protein n=1 Tax=Thermosipho atlanticus DSM 15807 TaxID=1123380 RepID=A0A1M5U584_9BACT|nr:ATP-binding cassette domain-containing protein [Thermosipho atlanticus]SHH58177.1 ABC-2 type transport system ATP-binding protein [Thermosipho atlanticus DSM 15807]
MILKVKNLKKYYGKNKAVDNISFEVQKGEVFALLGPNGAGKTTTLKCILGLRKKNEGNITLNGTYAYLPEKKELYHHLTVEKMLNVTEELSKYFSKQKAIELLEDFKINLTEKIANLSHGMLTQLYISIVFSEDVDIYFLDEPTWGLDPLMRNKVLNLIRIMSNKGKTIVYTSHILSEVEKIAEKVAIMSRGKILENDYLDNIKEKYVACIVTNEDVDGYLYKQTENEKIYITTREKAKGKIEPVTFDLIFEALVKGVKK